MSKNYHTADGVVLGVDDAELGEEGVWLDPVVSVSSGPYSLGHVVDGTNAIPIKKIILIKGTNITKDHRPDWLKSCNLLIEAHKMISTNHTIINKKGIATSIQIINDGNNTMLCTR